MRRLAALVLALAAVALVAGCDAGRPPAAKVGQVEISADQLKSDLEAEAARAKAIKSGDTPAREVEDTWSAAAAAELLGRRIRYELLGLGLAAKHATVTDEDRTNAEQSLCSGGATQNQTQQSGCPGLKGYPSDYRTFQIELAARGNAYQKALAADDRTARQRYRELQQSDPDKLEVRCYVGAIITDQSVVQAIQLGVAGGKSFADAVAAVDGAQVQGGQQCLPSSVLPKEVANAKEGTVLGPYSNSSGGQFVVQVQDRRTGTYDEVADVLKQQLSTQIQRDAVEELLAQAEVKVDPRYGHWERKSGTVVPPARPTSTTSDSTPASA